MKYKENIRQAKLKKNSIKILPYFPAYNPQGQKISFIPEILFFEM